MPTERPDAVLLAGESHTLIGDEVTVGSPAPDFRVISRDLQPITLASSAAKTRIVLTVPSMDTSVCHREALEFSRRANELTGTEILVVSVDLPFALRRWCAAEKVENLTMGSDHLDVSFGAAWGVLVKGFRILSRAAFVVNAQDTVTYADYLRNTGDEPDYDAVIRAAKESAATPA